MTSEAAWMRPKRRTPARAFATLGALAVAFEGALLLNSEPLPPGGPLGLVLERGIATLRSGPGGTPGLVVLIVRDGAISFTYANGFAVARATRVTLDTRFRAGSLAKMFTAVTIAQLVEAGRVELDAYVSRYLPSAPHAREITVRQLLAQTSGLPSVTEMAFATGLVLRPTTPEDLLAPLVAQPLDFAPGASYEYSNTNYVVLARIVETLERRPLADIERERILTPAQMTATSFGGSSAGPLAVGYDDPAGTSRAAPYDVSWLYGGGDLITTGLDLARFDNALMDGKLVSLAMFARMQRAGLGFAAQRFGTQTIIGHHANVPGFAADDEMIARARFAVVVLANRSNFQTSGVAGLAFATLDPTDFVLAHVHASSNTVTPLPPSSALP